MPPLPLSFTIMPLSFADAPPYADVTAIYRHFYAT